MDVTEVLTNASEKGGSEFHYVNVGATNEQGEFVVHKTIAVKEDSELFFRVYETDRGTASVGLIPGATKKEDIYISVVERRGPSTKVYNWKQRVTTDKPFKMRHHSGKKFKDHILVYNADIPADRYILKHTGNNYDDTTGCFVIGDKNLQLSGLLYTEDKKKKEIVPIKKNGKHLRGIVVSNSKHTFEKVHSFVKGKGKNNNGDYNMLLNVYEKLTDEERKQVVDPNSIVHPDNKGTSSK